MVRTGAVWILALTAFGVGSVTAQQPKPTFEVASVKPTTVRGATKTTASTFDMTLPLASLIAYAYRLPTMQVLDGEAWMRSQLFAVRTKLPQVANGKSMNVVQQQEQVALMMRHLLAERFALRVREEERMLPRYVLRIKNSKGKAPGLSVADARCVQARDKSLARRVGERVAEDQNRLPEEPCGFRIGRSSESLSWSSRATNIKELVSNIQLIVKRPVVDQTGIQGDFGLKLTMGADQDPQSFPSSTSSQPSSGPSLSTALAENLNLALISERGPVRVVVIQHAERPTPN